MVSVEENNETKDCIYKDEHYSVRDNGAVMRHPRKEMTMFGLRFANIRSWGNMPSS